MVPCQNWGKYLFFQGKNLVIREDIMKIKYLVLVIAIVLALIVIGPVSAYSIKVSTINSDSGSIAHNSVIPK